MTKRFLQPRSTSHAISIGDVVAFPLTVGGWGVAVVARTAKEVVRSSRMVYLYGMQWRTEMEPTSKELPNISHTIPIAQGKTGDAEVRNGSWKVLGKFPGFDRLYWPLPRFLVRVSREMYGADCDHCDIIEHSDDDLGKIISHKSVSPSYADTCLLPKSVAYSPLSFVYYIERRLGVVPARPPVNYYDGTQYDDLVLPMLGQHANARLPTT